MIQYSIHYRAKLILAVKQPEIRLSWWYGARLLYRKALRLTRSTLYIENGNGVQTHHLYVGSSK